MWPFAGTYSSVFIAAPILIFLDPKLGDGKDKEADEEAGEGEDEGVVEPA